MKGEGRRAEGGEGGKREARGREEGGKREEGKRVGFPYLSSCFHRF
jgi:hypothetical protein